MSAADIARVEFRLLGPLEVVVAGEERPIPGEKLQALLVCLLLEPNRSVSTDSLIDALWGESAPAGARQSLHAHVTRLRRLLDPGGGRGQLLSNDARGYRLLVESDRLDVTAFRSLLRTARERRAADRLDDARTSYEQALALWRGRFLEGIELDRAEPERAELEGLRREALSERIDTDLALGRSAALVPELERLTRVEPLHERFWGQLMLALYAGGRQADALAAYQQARRALGDYGLEPGPALREVEQAILNHDPTLAADAPPSVASPRRRVARGRTVATLVAVLAAATVAAVAWATRSDPPSAAPPAPLRAAPNTLVQLDGATREIVSVTSVGQGPDSLAATEDAIWVVNFGDRTVSRVSLPDRDVRTVGGVPVAAQVVSALNGDVWVSSFEEPYVTRIASRGEIAGDADELAGAPLQVKLPGSAEGLAVGGGYLWVTSPSDSGGANTISRIDLRTRRVVSSLPVGEVPIFAAFGYGSAWVSNYRGGSVSVIRPGTERVETIPVVGGPLGITSGAGAIWVVTYDPARVLRVDPETRRVVASIPVGLEPLSVAVGAGSVWVTNRGDGTVSRIDPDRNRVVETLRLGDGPPMGVRVANGSVWVTVGS